MAPENDDSDSLASDGTARLVTRRRVLKGLAGLPVVAVAGSALIEEGWATEPNSPTRVFGRETAERFMRRAVELSRQGMEAGDGGPFGAVIVKGEEIIGEGWNRVLATNDPTAHAEMGAIRAAARSLGSFSLKGCELYASAQPCPMCLGALYWARIDRLYYGNSVKDTAAIGFDDEIFYRQLNRSPEERAIPEVQLLAEEAHRVFREYAARPEARRY